MSSVLAILGVLVAMVVMLSIGAYLWGYVEGCNEMRRKQ